MQPFFFQIVPEIHYGPGAAAKVGSVLQRFGARQALVVTDPGVLAAGVCRTVLDSLTAAGIRHTLFHDVATNPCDTHVMAAVAAFGEAGADCLVGVGGGSPMDVAKSAAAVIGNGGDIREYEDGGHSTASPGPPLVFVPTTAGTGSEVVGGTIIVDTSRPFKMHIVAVPGKAAFCDPLLTLSLPPAVTAATGLDALSHAIGAYVSADRQPLADAYALYAIEQIRHWLMPAVSNGANLEARSAMMVASLTAGISMKGGGSGEHAFAHGVNALHNVHHGVACALFLADVMEFNLPHVPERYARIAEALGVLAAGRNAVEHGRAGIAAVRDLVRRAGIPTFAQLGVSKGQIPGLVDYAMQDAFHLGLNPVPITVEDAERILTITLAA